MSSTEHTYRNPELPTAERVKDLLSRMSVEEKAAQFATPFGAVVDVHNPPTDGWGGVTAGLSSLNMSPREMAEVGNRLQQWHIDNTRHGIPVLLTEEALLGLKVQGATTFPDAIAQAATWDPELIEQVGRVIGRHMALLGVRQALAPLADVARDPRWGRVEETYGEEPYLVGSMAAAYVRGLQNADPDSPLVATVKHFLGYAATDGGRNTDAAHIGPRELREVYAVPFAMAIHLGGARGIMPAYNTIDQDPVSGSKELLTGLLSEELGFTGLVSSDLGAIPQLHTKHGTAASFVDAFAQTIRAGMHMDLDNQVSVDRIVEAVRTGALSEEELDTAIGVVLATKFDLGLFERPLVDASQVPETLDSDEDRALSLVVAEKSIVLLQNDPGPTGAPILPLSPQTRKIAVIGPNANRPMGQLGNYSYQVMDSMIQRFSRAADPLARVDNTVDTSADNAELLVESVPVVTFLDGIRARAGADADVLYARGCSVVSDDTSGFAEAERIAASADVAVVVVGDQSGVAAFGTVGEGIDSVDCRLPGVQRELIEAIAATGTPTVVVLSHGRVVELDWLAELVPAVVTSFFGGQEAGTAMAHVLFGDVSPAGRLPIGMPRSAAAAPVPYWRSLQPASYFDGSVAAVYPFGHGLSYTTFEYRDLELASSEIPVLDTICLSFTLVNTGAVAGEEVVQIYGHDLAGRTARPGRVLLGFTRVHVAAGGAERVDVEIPATMFALWDATDGWVIEPGDVRIFIGASAADIRLQKKLVLTGAGAVEVPYRALQSTISSQSIDSADLAPLTPEQRAVLSADIVTAQSTVLEWFEHPLGGVLLREALDGVHEDVVIPAYGSLPLSRMTDFGSGQLNAAVVETLAEQVARAYGSDALV